MITTQVGDAFPAAGCAPAPWAGSTRAATLPGAAATISCPHSYPRFYEPLGLDRGHRFLEIGSGSGYSAAVAPLADAQGRQILTLLTKQPDGTMRREALCEVLYVALRRREGESPSPRAASRGPMRSPGSR